MNDEKPIDHNPVETQVADFDIDDSRLRLVWKMLVFQAKLVVDGMRDVLLIPAAIIAVGLGILVGGKEPDRYYRQLLHLGRRSERWINLFGGYSHHQTADELLKPIEEQVFAGVRDSTTLSKANEQMNRSLDALSTSALGNAETDANKKQDNSEI